MTIKDVITGLVWRFLPLPFRLVNCELEGPFIEPVIVITRDGRLEIRNAVISAKKETKE